MTKPSTSRTLSILTPVRHTTAKIRIRTIPTLAQLQRPVNHGSRRFPTRRSRTELVALHQERPRHSRNGSPDMARLQRSNTAPSSNLYNVMEPREAANGAPDAYYPRAKPPNGNSASNKRGREDDDAEEDVKRQKTDTNEGGPVGGSPSSVN